MELHGTNSLVECQTCHLRRDPQPYFDFFRVHRTPPLCTCGGFLKPATISFGQSLEPNELKRASEGAMRADLAIALGSTLVRLSGRWLSLAHRAPRQALRDRQSRGDRTRSRAVCLTSDRRRGWRDFSSGRRVSAWCLSGPQPAREKYAVRQLRIFHRASREFRSGPAHPARAKAAPISWHCSEVKISPTPSGAPFSTASARWPRIVLRTKPRARAISSTESPARKRRSVSVSLSFKIRRLGRSAAAAKFIRGLVSR